MITHQPINQWQPQTLQENVTHCRNSSVPTWWWSWPSSGWRRPCRWPSPRSYPSLYFQSWVSGVHAPKSFLNITFHYQLQTETTTKITEKVIKCNNNCRDVAVQLQVVDALSCYCPQYPRRLLLFPLKSSCCLDHEKNTPEAIFRKPKRKRHISSSNCTTTYHTLAPLLLSEYVHVHEHLSKDAFPQDRHYTSHA